jgi:hypothetical protein
MNLIANTGIQLFTFPLEINLNDNFKMFFHEWFDVIDEKLKLEIAHNFKEDDIWVSKKDIFNLLGLGLSDGKVGNFLDGVFIPYKWEEIKDDFHSEGNKILTPMESEDGGVDCFQISINHCKMEKFENHWLPFPFFNIGSNGRSEFAPTNWCRFKLIPDLTNTNSNSKKYNILISFDTRSKFEEEDFEDEDLMETPVFSNRFEKSKDYALCNNEFALVDFCSKTPYSCEWVDEYILDLFHNQKSVEELRIKKPKMNYLAQYIFILKYIQQLNILPTITLFSDKNVAFVDVDLIVDMGNSRTCAVLFDNHDFTKVQALGLQNFSNPVKDGKINLQNEPFDMRLAFSETDFGVNTLKGSSQFVFPSMVRLGNEANELIHKAVNLNEGTEKITTFSSPKRYLWDNKPQNKDWEFLTFKGEKNRKKLIQIKGITEQLNSDGSLNITGDGVMDKNYSRKALMTFAFLEILAQSKMQINSYEYRHKWGEEFKPRSIGRIIITCPTAMSKVEQIALRKCAEDAAIIIDRFYKGTYSEEIDIKDANKSLQIIPSSKKLLKTIENKEWIYDEATCSQFVYLYSELIKRYRSNCIEYFDFYGKVRNDLGAYSKKSLTIGSIDFGAGTTDLMIAAYKYDDAGQCKLTPIPLFWESFYIAGDDLLKNMIRLLIIEGQHAVISNHLKNILTIDSSKLILDFFGENNARQSITDRQMRGEFNLQVSIPVVTHFLELLRENKIEKATLNFTDIFKENMPIESVLEHFEKHFKFSVKDLQWHFDKEIVSKIVENSFDSLIGKISAVLSYYSCDIVLLTGRPISLKPLSDLFLKYYAVSPNRLVSLNNYRIGTWYPFQNGNGYFSDSKSIVAIGAMIGNIASTKGGIDGFYLDLTELINEMQPTTEYFTKSENGNPFITPSLNNTIIDVSQLPMRIWTRQLDTPKYPTRSFYLLDFNEEKIKVKLKNKLDINDSDKKAINEALTNELERLRNLGPFKIRIVRENYLEDKEGIKIESVEDRNREELPAAFFLLQIQSMSENENYWLDSGEFDNLSFQNN